MAGAFQRRLIDEGRSFLTAEGGGSKVGEKIFDERVTLYSDPQNDDVPYSPWAGDGQAHKKRMWIEDGVVKNVGCSRWWFLVGQKTMKRFKRRCDFRGPF